MPSGPKKRKSAKKKKEQEANNSSSANNSNTKTLVFGNDDPKSQDERERDGGGVGSPASQGHHNHQHSFKEGSKESEKRDSSPFGSFDSENKSMEEISREVEGSQKLGVEDDDATKIERELKSEDLGIQNISVKHDEFVKDSHDGSSSSSSSSDNESQMDVKASKKAAYSSHNGEKKPADSFPKEVIQGTEKVSIGESDKSVVETAPGCHSAKSEEMINVTQGDSFENSAVSDVVESRLNENEESKRNEENIFPLSENVGASLTVVETVAYENDDKILPTSVTLAESSNGAGSPSDSKIPDSSENQHLVAPAPQVEQRTCWINCCGLLDVLTGSGR